MPRAAPISKPLSDRAQALLDAHVAYVVEQLSGDGLAQLIEVELDAVLADAGRLRLKDVVSARMLKDSARSWMVGIDLGERLAPLVGAVAQAVHAHPILDRTTPGDVIAQARYMSFVDRLLELKSLRETLVREAAGSPMYIAFAAELLYSGIKGYLARSSELTRGIPGASSMMKLGRSVVSRASPGLEQSLDDSLKKYVARSVEATARSSAEFVLRHLNDAALRDMARELWHRTRSRPLSRLRAEVGSEEVAALADLFHAYGRELRHTELCGSLTDAAIDVCYAACAEMPLNELLDQLGLSRALMRAEAVRFAPQVIRVLKRKKLLDAMVRRRLAGFYHSGAVERVLATVP